MQKQVSDLISNDRYVGLEHRAATQLTDCFGRDYCLARCNIDGLQCVMTGRSWPRPALEARAAKQPLVAGLVALAALGRRQRVPGNFHVDLWN